MKRVVLVLCLVAAMVVPAVALAGLVFPPDNDYQGRLEGDPNTYIGFDVHKRHGRLNRVSGISTAIPVTCYSRDTGIIDVRLPGSVKVERLLPIRGGPRSLRRLKLFEAEGRVNTWAGLGTLEVVGLLRPHGRSAGAISIHTHHANLGRCYSGYLEWKAQRGAHLTLPAAKP
jgi:hypothetical protein